MDIPNVFLGYELNVLFFDPMNNTIFRFQNPVFLIIKGLLCLLDDDLYFLPPSPLKISKIKKSRVRNWMWSNK